MRDQPDTIRVLVSHGAAINARDKKGFLPLHLALGTPVLNVRLSKALFHSREGRQSVRDLIEGYFRMGGMQLQVSVVDQAVLSDAIAHPERHEDLIVRVGGFSAHFNTLSEDLKRTVLERTEHAF